MTRAGRAAVAVVAALALRASAARADEAPAEAAPPPPAGAAAPTNYAPPPPPPVVPGPAPGALTPRQLVAWENESKSHGLAVLLSWFPGLGCIYADHLQGFLVTWLGVGPGIGLVVYGAVGLDRGSVSTG